MTGTVEAAPRRRRAQRGSGEQLREEIIAAARDLLASTGRADDVSIRAVADAVGVTSPSIYLHFEDKNALLAAVVADVFAELDQAMLSAGAGVADPFERLHLYGLAYVRFALSHPEHYRIAALDPCPTPAVDEVLASSAFLHLNETVLECMQAGIFAPGDPMPVTLQLWAAAHGIASLMITKPFLPWGDVDETTNRVLCAAAFGLAGRELVGTDPTPGELSSWLAEHKGSAGPRHVPG
jgi:AcrR family transcriptional regulator